MRRAFVASVSLLALIVAAAPAVAQRADSARIAVTPAPRTTPPTRAIGGPPVSPKRALLYSLILPGLGQAKLDRANAGMLYVTVEAMSLAMIQKSKRSLRLAQSIPDSTIIGYSDTDTIVYTGFRQRQYRPKPIREVNDLSLRVRSRKTQVEDWVAVLLFNHFFSGADAFVAAQLWDLPTVLKAESRGSGAALTARIYW